MTAAGTSVLELSDRQLDALAKWATLNHTAWPLYGRLWAWLELRRLHLNPEDAADRAAFRWLREAVACRIVTAALDDAGWTFDQLSLDGIGARQEAAA